jgi:putative molybdopterin biosynthesis protein
LSHRVSRSGPAWSDSNAAILAAAVEEAGGCAKPLGIGPDDELILSGLVDKGLATCDMVILSGGTSKGAGDLCYAISSFKDPGIIVHGVALKPGKPLCLAVTAGKPIAILPGFPTSAIFTFHEFVAPVIRAFAGFPAKETERLQATLPMRIASERGRTEYLMVSLVLGEDEQPLPAYPNSKGSGAVTAFSQADGFITIGQHVETVPAGTPVEVQLVGRAHLVDLVIIGSHCVGLDVLIGRLQSEGISVKALSVGSTGGLAAAKRGECDIAAIHLMDPETGEYNRPFLTAALKLVTGYRRLQGILYRKGDPCFEGRSLEDAIIAAIDAHRLMVNRNSGSGTRILTDRLLGGAKPAGY